MYVCMFVLIFSCRGQANKNQFTKNSDTSKSPIGGGCDGCELMYVGMPQDISSKDTSAGWFEKGQKLLIEGRVVKPDGKTGAAGVVLYYWHTNSEGYYAQQEGMDTRARRHGYLRGWVKSDQDGNYFIYTNRPVPYPNEKIPAHIHISVKEPQFANEYYTDELVFDDDVLLTNEKRKLLPNRGGTGILKTVTSGYMQVTKHQITLGLNIPHYPPATK